MSKPSPIPSPNTNPNPNSNPALNLTLTQALKLDLALALALALGLTLYIPLRCGSVLVTSPPYQGDALSSHACSAVCVCPSPISTYSFQSPALSTVSRDRVSFLSTQGQCLDVLEFDVLLQILLDVLSLPHTPLPCSFCFHWALSPSVVFSMLCSLLSFSRGLSFFLKDPILYCLSLTAVVYCLPL